MIGREQREEFAEQLRRRRGRPRRSDRPVRASVNLPEHVYDALCRSARAQRKSLHALMCEILAKRSGGSSLEFR